MKLSHLTKVVDHSALFNVTSVREEASQQGENMTHGAHVKASCGVALFFFCFFFLIMFLMNNGISDKLLSLVSGSREAAGLKRHCKETTLRSDCWLQSSVLCVHILVEISVAAALGREDLHPCEKYPD